MRACEGYADGEAVLFKVPEIELRYESKKFGIQRHFKSGRIKKVEKCKGLRMQSMRA